MTKEILFDPDGKCPICYKLFKSDQCKHSYDYVDRVIQAVNDKRRGKDFNKDVDRLLNDHS